MDADRYVANALVYKTREGYAAEGHEISQLGIGRTREEAIDAYLRAVEAVFDEAERKCKVEVFDRKCSERCIRGLEKIAVSGKGTCPDVRSLLDLEVYFYDEIRRKRRR